MKNKKEIACFTTLIGAGIYLVTTGTDMIKSGMLNIGIILTALGLGCIACVVGLLIYEKE